jgi:hypothetical protein
MPIFLLAHTPTRRSEKTPSIQRALTAPDGSSFDVDVEITCRWPQIGTLADKIGR